MDEKELRLQALKLAFDIRHQTGEATEANVIATAKALAAFIEGTDHQA